MESISRVISKIQQEYADLTDATTIQEFIDDAYRKLLSRSQARNKAVYVTLVASTAEYDFPDAGIMKIHDCYYQGSSDPSTWLPLQERSLDEFNVKRRGWQMATTTGVVEYYITSSDDGDSAKPRIGFYGTPTTSSSPTYPRVKIDATVWAQLSGSETIPSNMLGSNYFVAYACRRWAELRHTEDEARWLQKEEFELEENVAHIKNIQAQAPDLQLVPPQYFANRVI